MLLSNFVPYQFLLEYKKSLFEEQRHWTASSTVIQYSSWKILFHIKCPKVFIFFAISIYARIEKEIFWRAAAVNCQLHCYITSSSHCKRKYSNWLNLYSAGSNSTPLPFSFSIPSLLSSIKVAKNKVRSNPQL